MHFYHIIIFSKQMQSYLVMLFPEIYDYRSIKTYPFDNLISLVEFTINISIFW